MRRRLAIRTGGVFVLWLVPFTPATQVPVPPTSAAQVAVVQPGAFRLEPTDAPSLTVRYTPDQLGVLEKLNRRDLEHLVRLETIVVPEVWADELALAPLPQEWGWAQASAKVIVVHQRSQVFGGYEFGRLVRWGPVSTGRRDTPTPAGVFNLTWRARSRRSTDNNQWLLEWYFNFINARGISFHQFDLPGVAASHACVRLLERDAMWLYGWGESWTISANQREVLTKGTPVVILGVYDFAQPPPWLSLDWWRTPVVLPNVPPQ